MVQALDTPTSEKSAPARNGNSLPPAPPASRGTRMRTARRPRRRPFCAGSASGSLGFAFQPLARVAPGLLGVGCSGLSSVGGAGGPAGECRGVGQEGESAGGTRLVTAPSDGWGPGAPRRWGRAAGGRRPASNWASRRGLPWPLLSGGFLLTLAQNSCHPHLLLALVS